MLFVYISGMFSTSRQSRLQQLLDWCGGADFEGCLVFDECHKAKNFVPGKETASTKVALAVTQMQKSVYHITCFFFIKCVSVYD